MTEPSEEPAMTDPTADRQAHTSRVDRATPRVAGEPSPPSGTEPPAATSPFGRVDPAHPSDRDWREPAWIPPRGRGRHGAPRRSMFWPLVGLLLIALGVYLFLERTLGLHLPQIPWSSLWPVLLIVVGGLLLIRSMDRRP